MVDLNFDLDEIMVWLVDMGVCYVGCFGGCF